MYHLVSRVYLYKYMCMHLSVSQRSQCMFIYVMLGVDNLVSPRPDEVPLPYTQSSEAVRSHHPRCFLPFDLRGRVRLHPAAPPAPGEGEDLDFELGDLFGGDLQVCEGGQRHPIACQ